MKYKALTKDNEGSYSGFDFTEYLPKGNKPGKWMPKVEDLEMCESGYHYSDENHIIVWLNDQIYEVETKGNVIDGVDKSAAQQMRFVRKCEKWNEKTARLFACDCAEHVLHLFEEKYPDDRRPRNAIDTARKYAGGKATKEELAAAGATAGNAAWDAAWAAAGAAAAAAAWAAAGAAAGAAARAAWAAAGAAAWAAGAAAGNAAWAAAWAAERTWQNEKLSRLLQ